MNLLSERLRHYRNLSNMTQHELARSSGVSIVQIARIESGNVKSPKVETIEKLAAALNTSIESFLDKKEMYKTVGYDAQLLDSMPRMQVMASKIKKNGIPYDQKALDCYLSPEADQEFIQEARSLFFNYLRKRFGDDYDMTKILEKYSLDDIQIKYKLIDDQD